MLEDIKEVFSTALISIYEVDLINDKKCYRILKKNTNECIGRLEWVDSLQDYGYFKNKEADYIDNIQELPDVLRFFDEYLNKTKTTSNE